MLSKQCKGFDITNDFISKIGTVGQNVKKLFGILMVSYGIFAVCFIIVLQNSLPAIPEVEMFIGSLYAVCMFTALIGIFPMHTSHLLHTVFGFILFTAVVIATIFSTRLITPLNLLPKILIPINLGILITTTFFALARAYEKIPSLTNNTLSFIQKHRGLWEWSIFVLTCIWNLITAIYILNTLL